MAGYSRMDGIMLEQMLDDRAFEAGIYARSFRLYDTLNNFTFLFAVLLLPMFSRMIKAEQAVKDLVSWSFKLISIGSLFVIIAVYFRGEDILRVFYRDVSEGFPYVLFLLMIAGYALSLNYIYGTLLTANGSIARLNIIALTGFGLNILVNLFLIPRWQGNGAALATVLTQYLVLILQIIYSYKLFDLTFSVRTAAKLGLLCLACIFAFYLMTVTWPTHLIICLLIAGMATILIAIAIRLVSYKDFIPSFHTFAK
jgi:O-antigen/teichoic acid export membrane protein